MVEREQSEVTAERNAFRRFAHQIDSFNPTNVAPRTPPTERVISSPDGGHDTLAHVREAYRDTVMSLSHYEREYGEPLANNLTAELGPELAVGLCGDGVDAFSRWFNWALLGATTQTIQKRSAMLDELVAEATSLENSRATLTDVTNTLKAIERSEQSIPDQERTFCSELKAILDHVARERQEHIHSAGFRGFVDQHDLCAYLYSINDWKYPVLQATASLRSAIETAEIRRVIK